MYHLSNHHLMKHCLLLGLCLTMAILAQAQSEQRIFGQLYDEAWAPLPLATVVLFDLQDSTLVDYTLSSDKGAFVLSGPIDRRYQLQISYLGYEPLLQDFTLTQVLRLDSLQLQPASMTLNTAVIEAEHIPLRMNGDTLEFNSAAFSVQAHDKVEDLLKQLPGVEVDDQGNVLVNGKKVEKITVDGKDFFGENAQVALKSLPANAIDKVQAFDKKNEKEELLGKAASGDLKQLNLTLKEDKKTGYMGDVKAGYGYSPDDGHRYEGNLNLHYFNPKMRLSLVGGSSNINELAINFGTLQDMTGGWSRFVQSNSNLHLSHRSLVQPMVFNRGVREGIIQTTMGGTNANLFLHPKTDLSIHYLYANQFKTLEQGGSQRSVTSDNFFSTLSERSRLPLAQSHNANIKFEHRLDSSQTLKGRFRFRHNINDRPRGSMSDNLDASGNLTNRLTQTFEENQTNTSGEGHLHYNKKFKKEGRAFWANVNTAQQGQRRLSINEATTELYSNGQPTARTELSQDQRQQEGRQIYVVEAGYAEPLGEATSLEFEAVGAWNNEQMNQETYDRQDERLVLDPLLTDRYNKWYNYQLLATTITHTIGEKKWNLGAQAGVQRAQLQGLIQSAEQRINQTFIYPVGEATAAYRFKTNASLRFQYRTAVREPSLQNLQPLLNNNNPLLLRQGNPDLVPAYIHRANLGFFHFKAGNFQMFNIGYTATVDNIVQQRFIDEQLRTVMIPVNFGTQHSTYLNWRYGSKVKKFLKWTLRGSARLNQTPLLINDAIDEQWNTHGELGLKLENPKKKQMDLSVEARVQFNRAMITENTALNSTAIQHDYQAKAKWTPGNGWAFNTSFHLHVFEPLGFEERFVLPIWQASISKTLLKSEALQLTLRADNLLNQRFFINRSQWGGNLTETRTNLLGRFFMLSVSYKVDKMGGKKRGMDQIMIID